MAARTRKVQHDDLTRQRIQTSQIVNRLHAHVFEGVEVSSTQLKAIEILLRKSLPDLQSVQLTGKDGGPLEMNVTDSERARALASFVARLKAKE